MIFELPLFPLNTVLFPGMPLNLHIFEGRYKKMIRSCLETERPFGVTLIRSGQEAFGPPAETHEIGCTARIIDVEHLDEGRMNIVVRGEARFRIVSIKQDKPYLLALVEDFPLHDFSDLELNQPVNKLLPWVKRYMQILGRLSEVELITRELPQEPLVLAYLAAVLLQIPPDQKQDLLASRRAVDLIAEMQTLYRREVALMDAIVSGESGGRGGIFSSN
jgi:uncharacterized protein